MVLVRDLFYALTLINHQKIIIYSFETGDFMIKNQTKLIILASMFFLNLPRLSIAMDNKYDEMDELFRNAFSELHQAKVLLNKKIEECENSQKNVESLNTSNPQNLPNQNPQIQYKMQGQNFSNQQPFNPPPKINPMPVHGGNVYPQVQYEIQGHNLLNQQDFNPPPKRNDFSNQQPFNPQFPKDENPWPQQIQSNQRNDFSNQQDFNYSKVFENEASSNRCANLRCKLTFIEGGIREFPYTERQFVKKEATGFSITGNRKETFYYEEVPMSYKIKESGYWRCDLCKTRNSGSIPEVRFKEQNNNSFSSDGRTRIMDIDLPFLGATMCRKPKLDGKLLTIWNRAKLQYDEDWSDALESMWRASRQLDVEVYGEDLKGITYKVKSSHCTIF